MNKLSWRRKLPVEAIYILGGVALIAAGFAAYFLNTGASPEKKTLIVGALRERSSKQRTYQPDILRSNGDFAAKVRHGESGNFWAAARLTNSSDKSLSICVWNSKDQHWLASTLMPGQTKHIVRQNEAIHVLIQGDMILNSRSPKKEHTLTHTSRNTERYELQSMTFDHEPTDSEQRTVPGNVILRTSIGVVVTFADKSEARMLIVGADGNVCTGFVPAEQVGLEPVIADADLTLLVPDDDDFDESSY